MGVRQQSLAVPGRIPGAILGAMPGTIHRELLGTRHGFCEVGSREVAMIASTPQAVLGSVPVAGAMPGTISKTTLRPRHCFGSV